MTLVDPWYGDAPLTQLTTDEDLCFSFLNSTGIVYSDHASHELSDTACMRLCGALESELV